LRVSPFSRAPYLFAAAAAAILADQAVKYAVERYLPFQEPVHVVPTLALYRTYNDGIAFSMLSGLTDFALAVLALVVVLFVTYLWRKTPPDRLFAHPGFALILGGAIGNLIDRVAHGYVIDYVLFYVGDWSFAVFNLADALISVGAAMVVLDEAIDWLRNHRRLKSDERRGN
jgi:lipoprotein signal peptidase